MQITDVKIRKTFEDQPLKAVLSVTLDNCFAIHDVKLVYARDRYFVVMPSKKTTSGDYRDIVHPINAAFRRTLESTLIAAYLADTQSDTPVGAPVGD